MSGSRNERQQEHYMRASFV